MHQGYLSFLIDLTARGNHVVEDSVRYEPTPAQHPANAFQWKIVVDVKGTVVVRGHADSRYRVLGKAVLGTGLLGSSELTRHSSLDETPNSFQWKLVEVAVREELARAGDRVRTHPTWVEKVEVDDFVDTHVEEVDLDAHAGPPPRHERRGSRVPVPTPHRKRILLLVAASAAAIVIAIGVVVATSNPSRPAVAPPPAGRVRTVDATLARPPIDAPLPLEEQVARAPDFASALTLARPVMDDSPAELSPGAELVAHYASHRLRWADVGGAPETTIGHVLKDPAVERGKRLCASGTVQSIERRDLEQRKIYVGRLTTADEDEIAFVAVGSTTDIVKRSRATICGAVIGRAGGAVSLVGMFDLPENRTPIVESER